MKIRFLGAAGDVTGSAYQVITKDASILVDCGFFQGRKEESAKNRRTKQIEDGKLDAVVLTHGHLDHIGRLPLLTRNGYKGPVYATKPTLDLATLILKDSLGLQKQDLKRQNLKRARQKLPPLAPLFEEGDVRKLKPLIAPVKYNQRFEVARGIEARLVDAGHVIGSSSVELTVSENGRKNVVVFSGDLGPRGAPLLNDPVPFKEADAVIMESTYGDRNHRSLHDTAMERREIIARAIQTRPRFSCRSLPSDGLNYCSTYSAAPLRRRRCRRFRSTWTARWRSRRRRSTGETPSSSMRKVYRRGVATMLDVRQAEELVYDATEVIPALEQSIEQTENFLSFLTGRNPSAIERGLSLTEHQLPPTVPAGLPSDLLERRPDIRAAVTNHFDLTFRLWAKDGRLVWVQNLISVNPQSDGAPKLHGFMIDVSDRKRTEEALMDLGGRLIAAQEEEQRRVARELHDDFNQRLAVLSIELEQLGNKMQSSLGLRHSVERLKTQARELAAEIHRLSYKLHPAKLDHLGLAAAIKSLCAELNESEKLKVEFYQTGFPAAVDKEITLCVFRIAQESLRNCVKHSQAESVRVVLTRTRNAIRLLVSDNGCGFNINSDSMERGLGFISMKERLHLVGGKINVYSKPLRGTRIEVSVPLKLQAESFRPEGREK